MREIFRPFVPIMAFDSFDEAVAIFSAYGISPACPYCD
jgi:acyl-CoA reductase-like NAD-dependent aldehyde dehydrogenase